MTNIGNKIKELRIDNNLTQYELGERLFVSDKTISSWESGRTYPDIDMLLNLCKELNTNILTLINGNGNSDTELEIKIKVNQDEYERILDLISKESKHLKDETHLATYYLTQTMDDKNEWLRIRRENDNVILNFKKKDNDVIYEYEVGIDNEKNLQTIFELLGFKKDCEVNKKRKAYLYKNKYEVSFDDVDNLGLYVEFELKKYEKEYNEEYQDLIKLLYELEININDIETRRYPDLVKEAK